MGGKLAPSLVRLFPELDQRWPNRDRRTDGWYADPKVRKSLGHNPGHNGYSHAIDIDKDGIDQMWFIRNIAKDDKVLWYIIWNRKLYSNTYNWVPQPYTGSNPHTDHLHVEIYQTTYAENWTGQWRIKPPTGIPKGPPIGGGGDGPGGTYAGAFDTNYGGRDYRGSVTALGKYFEDSANLIGGYRKQMTYIRK